MTYSIVLVSVIEDSDSTFTYMIYISYDIITMVCLVTICYVQRPYIIDHIPCALHYHISVMYLFFNWKFVPLTHLHLKKKTFYLFIFREMGREGERGRKHQCVVASHGLPTGSLAHNPGMFPDWELDLRPFGSQASTQSTEPHEPGI